MIPRPMFPSQGEILEISKQPEQAYVDFPHVRTEHAILCAAACAAFSGRKGQDGK